MLTYKNFKFFNLQNVNGNTLGNALSLILVDKCLFKIIYSYLSLIKIIYIFI